MPQLIVSQDDGTQNRIPLGQAPVVVGREQSCDVPLSDASASRRHAKISWDGHRYVVEDLGSKNGTLINNEPCHVNPLRNGDRISIGSTVLLFSDEQPTTAGSVVVADVETVGHATRYVKADRQLLISQQRLRMLYDFSERLTTLQSRDQLLEAALEIGFETLSFERGAIGVRRVKERSVDWPVVRNLRGVEGELRISRTLLNRALEHGERAMFTEDGSPGADPTISMVQQGIRSALCVPLVGSDGILGVIYGDRTSTSTVYTDEDIDFLAGIARQVSIGLINCRLMDQQRDAARLHHEIDLARGIQNRLFPKSLPNESTIAIAALNEPGNRVSGDYYDVIRLPDGRVWCLMADVTGEGIAAAMLMAHFQAIVRATIFQSDDSAALFTQWNRLIHENTDSSRFITCALALIDPATGRIRLSSAGHCPSLMLTFDGAPPYILSLEAGFPLGVVGDAVYSAEVVDVASDRYVYFCHTDGVTEAANPSGELFGTQRLLDALAEGSDGTPTAIIKHVRKAVTHFSAGARQGDDITILAARVNVRP